MTTPTPEQLTGYIRHENVRTAMDHIMRGRPDGVDTAVRILVHSVHYQAFLLGVLSWEELNQER